MNCLQACRIFSWPARSPYLSPTEYVWDMIGMRLHLPEIIDDVAAQLERIWQGIPQEAFWMLYQSMPRRVADCIQTRSE